MVPPTKLDDQQGQLIDAADRFPPPAQSRQGTATPAPEPDDYAPRGVAGRLTIPAEDLLQEPAAKDHYMQTLLTNAPTEQVGAHRPPPRRSPQISSTSSSRPKPTYQPWQQQTVQTWSAARICPHAPAARPRRRVARVQHRPRGPVTRVRPGTWLAGSICAGLALAAALIISSQTSSSPHHAAHVSRAAAGVRRQPTRTVAAGTLKTNAGTRAIHKAASKTPPRQQAKPHRTKHVRRTVHRRRHTAQTQHPAVVTTAPTATVTSSSPSGPAPPTPAPAMSSSSPSSSSSPKFPLVG
jgi:hypothetical protein